MATKILLTIDDGFGSESHNLCDYLFSKGVGSIMFVHGSMQHNLHAQYALERDFILGNHTTTHPIMTQQSEERRSQEICSTDTWINQQYLDCGKKRPAKVFRFPFGMGHFHSRRLLKGMRFVQPKSQQKIGAWDWDAEVTDGRPYPEPQLRADVNRCLDEVEVCKHDIAIVLMHDQPDNIRSGVFKMFYQEAIDRKKTFLTNNDILRYLKHGCH